MSTSRARRLKPAPVRPGPTAGLRYLIDNSVWARVPTSPTIAQRVADIQRDHTICVTTAQMLEHGYSARNPLELDASHRAMSTFTVLHMSPTTHTVALGIQQRLWHNGLIRSAGAFDTLIAAVAIEHDVTVLHYDRDFEHIASVVSEFREESLVVLR